MTTPYLKKDEEWFLNGATSIPDEYILSDGLVSKRAFLREPKRQELFVACECRGEVVSIEKWEGEEEYYLTVYKYSFPNLSFWNRIKYAFDVLKGKGVSVAGVVLSKENFNKIKKFK